MLQPDKIYERLVDLGEAWADAHAAAEHLEETKKTLLAHIAAGSEASSMAAKESDALRNEDYRKHLDAMVAARKVANKAKVRYDSAKIWAELIRTQAANERAVLRSAP